MGVDHFVTPTNVVNILFVSARLNRRIKRLFFHEREYSAEYADSERT